MPPRVSPIAHRQSLSIFSIADAFWVNSADRTCWLLAKWSKRKSRQSTSSVRQMKPMRTSPWPLPHPMQCINFESERQESTAHCSRHKTRPRTCSNQVAPRLLLPSLSHLLPISPFARSLALSHLAHSRSPPSPPIHSRSPAPPSPPSASRPLLCARCDAHAHLFNFNDFACLPDGAAVTKCSPCNATFLSRDFRCAGSVQRGGGGRFEYAATCVCQNSMAHIDVKARV